FMTSTLPTPAIRELVSKYRYRLIPLPFREAFALGALTAEEPDRRPASDQGIALLKEHIYDVVIPAFTYQIDPGVPPQTIHTLGARVLLVANRKVDSGVVDRLLETIFHTHFLKNLLPLQGFAVRDAIPEIPWHPAALRYIQKDDPLVTSSMLEQLGEIVAIFGPTSGGLFCVWQWFRQRTRFHRERSFEAYISKVTALERRAMDLELNAPFETNLLGDLHNLHRELGKLKAEALGHFSRGELDGTELITSFLAHINDARTHLTGMIRRLREDAAQKPHDLIGDSPQRHKGTQEFEY
ncbi:type 2 periplasmic-binding domain-containing protein, partial [Singulisphaera rosea]